MGATGADAGISTADTGGSVDTSTATVDTAVADPGADTGDTGGTDTDPGAQHDGAQPGAAPTEPGRSLIENGKLTPAAKAVLENLQKTNPAEARQIKDALFLKDRLAQELPGGFKELKTLRQAVESFGGEQGLQEVKAELEGWAEFDNKWMAGDATVLDFLMKEDAGKEAFGKLAPAAFDRYAEINPDGWGNYIARQIASDMAAAELPMNLKLLAKFAPPEVQEYVKPVIDYFNRIAQISQKQPAAPAAKADTSKLDADRQKLDTDRKEFTRTQWRTEVDRSHGTIFQKSWASIVGDRKVTDVQRENINVLYQHELERLLPKDFNEKMQRYLDAGQKDGYMRHHASVFGSLVDRALRAAVNRTLPAKPGPAAAQPGQQQTAKPAAKPAPAARPGVEIMNQKPNMAEVNRSLTTPDMWLKGEAILKNGKHVKWNR